MRGITKHNFGNSDGAIEDSSLVIKINPKDSDAFFNRANIKKEIRDMKDALKSGEK